MRKKIIITSLAISLLVTSCAQNEPEPAIPAIPTQKFIADLQLPESLADIGITLDGQPLNISPVDTAYPGASIERCRWYNFVGLTAARYLINNHPVSVEIAQFVTPEDAYGFYALFRPAQPKLNPAGAESYSIGNSTYVHIGQYVLTLSVEDYEGNQFQLISPLIDAIVGKVGVIKNIPAYFLMFPYKYKLIPTTRYYPYDYLDIIDLDSVFTTDYLFETDTATLFYAVDETARKFKVLKKYGERTKRIVNNPKGFPFELDKAIAFEDPEHGIIVAGIINKRLVGVINYKPKTMESTCTRWVEGLK